MNEIGIIDDHLYETISRVYGFSFPEMSFLKANFEGRAPEEVEKYAQNFKLVVGKEILAWETQVARKNRLEWLEGLTAIAAVAAEDPVNLDVSCIDARLVIRRFSPCALPNTGDFVLSKINHGFWEKIFSILHDGYLQKLMRPMSRQGIAEAHLNSRFLDAFFTLSRDKSHVQGANLEFKGLDLGISFSSGDIWHDELMSRASKLDEDTLRIIRGVKAGLSIFLSQFSSVARAHFCDGAFAKQGLRNGTLNELLESFTNQVDHLAFVVPGHLEGVRLAGLSLERQQVLYVSGKFVHQSWPLMLAGIARPILARLAAGEHVGIIIQAAVFSALLPIYLVQAKSALGLPGRLTFLDLGQALDVVAPETGKTWIQKQRSSLAIDMELFPISLQAR